MQFGTTRLLNVNHINFHGPLKMWMQFTTCLLFTWEKTTLNASGYPVCNLGSAN